MTAVEADKLLGRQPDAILPNGLNIQKFAAPHEFQHLHQLYKERIHEFVMGHFFPSYTFDLDNTIYLVTSGRYEYRNKGMDLFIEALHRLNQRLRGVPDRPTIVAFIITKAPVRNINVGVLQSQSMFEDLHETCEELQEQMGDRLFQTAARGRIPAAMNELLPEDSQVRLKRALHAWRTNRQPAIVTHDLIDDAGDPVLKHLRHRWLFNAAGRSGQGSFPPAVRLRHQPDHQPRLRPVRARLSHGDLPQLLRAVGLHPDGVRGAGPAGRDDRTERFWRVRRTPHPRPRGPRHSRPAPPAQAASTRRPTSSSSTSCDSRGSIAASASSCEIKWSASARPSTGPTWSRHYDEAHEIALERIGVITRKSSVGISAPRDTPHAATDMTSASTYSAPTSNNPSGAQKRRRFLSSKRLQALRCRAEGSRPHRRPAQRASEGRRGARRHA